MGQGGFSPVKTDHSKERESGSKCHMRRDMAGREGAEGHRERGITPLPGYLQRYKREQ